MENHEFTYVSLFSGIGGFEQALNKHGGKCLMASEIDKFANKSYELLYGHKTAGDITKVAAEDVPDHDVLVGGFPCQAFSVAGKRLGFSDTRGTLFFEIARIAKEKQPKALLLENVKGLIGHDKGKTLDTIITTLNDIGYTVDFNVLNSKFFGVPQNRERIFIIAIRDDLINEDKWVVEGSNVVAKGKKRINDLLGVKVFNFNWSEKSSVTTRLKDVLENEVDRKYYLSEERTASLITQLENKYNGHEPRAFAERGRLQGDEYRVEREFRKDQLTNTLGRNTGLNLLAVPNMLGHIDLKGHDAIKRVYDPAAISPTLTTMGGGHREPKIAEKSAKRNYRIRKLTPKECFRLQGFSDKVYEKLKSGGISDSQLYKQAGNAVTVNVIDDLILRLKEYIK